MQTYQLPLWVWPATLLGVCVVAVLRGRAEERLAAAGNLFAWILTRLVYQAGSESTQWPIFVIDTAFLAILIWLAMRSKRFWPLFAAGFEILDIVTHFARAVDPRISGWAYLTAEIIWGYLVVFSIGYGAWTARRYAVAAGIAVSEDPGATLR